jgi:hypothetical protein
VPADAAAYILPAAADTALPAHTAASAVSDAAVSSHAAASILPAADTALSAHAAPSGLSADARGALHTGQSAAGLRR